MCICLPSCACVFVPVQKGDKGGIHFETQKRGIAAVPPISWFFCLCACMHGLVDLLVHVLIMFVLLCLSACTCARHRHISVLRLTRVQVYELSPFFLALLQSAGCGAKVRSGVPY